MKIGERVGDYEILQVLGAGGMGEVYKVRNVLSERVEAMKALLPNLGGESGTTGSGGGSVAERFQREIKVQAALDHPNLAKLYTAMTFNNQLLMLMEFVDGSPLSTLLKLGFVDVRESMEYTLQVLDALAYAHERGVVHRDIKPANIMRTASGKIKLLDFGIARMKTDPKLTQTGQAIGSVYYMSPEQIKGMEPDPRSDLYSLGIMLYEMVTGRRPFQGDSSYSIMAAHLGEAPVVPTEIVPGLHSGLSDIIMTAMAKEPASRFQTAQAFSAALRRAWRDGAMLSVALRTMVATPPLPHTHPICPPKTARNGIRFGTNETESGTSKYKHREPIVVALKQEVKRLRQENARLKKLLTGLL
jgi:serine/threonine-protein kinase